MKPTEPEFEQQLEEQLQLMDASLPIIEPDPAQLLLLVREVKAAQRQRLLRDLLRFWMAAALVLAACIWIASDAPEIYIRAQLALAGAGVCAAVLVGLATWRKRRLKASREGNLLS